MMTNREYITITAFARICGVPAKTLRFYDEIGLFRPAFINPRTRYRFYLQDQLRDFARIQAMRDYGASLREIREAMHSKRSAGEQRRFLRKLRDAKLAALDEARRSLAWIEGALQDFELQPPVHVTMRYCPPVAVASVRADLSDDEEAEDTHVGLSRWIRARGYRLASARREIYRGELLEIQYPPQAE